MHKWITMQLVGKKKKANSLKNKQKSLVSSKIIRIFARF